MTVLQKNAQEDLRRLVDQIERIQGEIKDLGEDLRDKMGEAKSRGFDTKILRRLLKLRKQTKSEREEEDAILTTYMNALDGTPLGAWAKSKELAN